MTPYYEDATTVLYLGDCREVLPAIACHPDVVLTDPPYGETSLDWDSWPAGWIDALPSSACQLWCFGSMRMILDHRDDFTASWTYGQEVVWRKHNGSGLHARRFRRVHEFAFHWYRPPWSSLVLNQQFTMDAQARTVRRRNKPTHWARIGEGSYESEAGGPRQMVSVLEVRSEHGRAVHPTQKPIGILEPLIRYSTLAGGLVVDPMAGSGSTLVAAKAAGRHAIGIEAREDYCERAAIRLTETLALS